MSALCQKQTLARLFDHLVGAEQNRRFLSVEERAMIQERVRAGLRRAKHEGKQLGRPRIDPELEKRIREALKAPGRTEGVRKIAARFGVNASTVQRINGPFGAEAA